MLWLNAQAVSESMQYIDTALVLSDVDGRVFVGGKFISDGSYGSCFADAWGPGDKGDSLLSDGGPDQCAQLFELIVFEELFTGDIFAKGVLGWRDRWRSVF